MLAWRSDRLPHGLLQEKIEEKAFAADTAFTRKDWEAALGQWFEDIGFTAQHPMILEGLKRFENLERPH